MKLTNITFTGIDMSIDIKRLFKIQQKYPIAEFGVLVSFNSASNGNRYPDMDLFDSTFWHEINLSMHVCGKAADCILQGQWWKAALLAKDNEHKFRRMQLNIANRTPNLAAPINLPYYIKELIIQQKDINKFGQYSQILSNAEDKNKISVLIDPSGGTGKYQPIKIPEGIKKFGCAGGLNHYNIGNVLEKLLTTPGNQEFWLDMETSVRTNEWFDLDKVEMILEICQDVINKHK